MGMALGIAAAVVVVAIWLYNRLVASRNTVLQAWSDIGVQLKRRHDLVPKLVDVVKAYAGYEQATLARVTELRAAAAAAQRPAAAGVAEGQLGSALHQLMAVAEAYPDLKANGQYLELMQQITAVEQDIQYARRFYNGAVKQLNVQVETVPGNFVAQAFRFELAEYFDTDAPA